MRIPTLETDLLLPGLVESISDHEKITAAGWAYRTNEHGWMIYREPCTGRWHTRDEAIRKVVPSPEPPNGMPASKERRSNSGDADIVRPIALGRDGTWIASNSRDSVN